MNAFDVSALDVPQLWHASPHYVARHHSARCPAATSGLNVDRSDGRACQ